VEVGAANWRDAQVGELADQGWLTEQPLLMHADAQCNPDGLSLPFQPLSFRDMSSYEAHWIQSSRGYVKRFMPVAHALASGYEWLLHRPFPAFKPRALAYSQPVYYFGNALSFVPSGVELAWPHFTRAMDYELELGIILSRPLHHATPDEALAAIGGLVVVNDWSARDIQKAEMDTGLGPQVSKHYCSSMSTELALAHGLVDRLDQLQAAVEINGRTVARTSTAGMLHSWGQVLSWLSRHSRLLAGELVASGTLPNGTGMETGHWLKPGDELRLLITDVGEIRHKVVA
jgi:2-keto-4-pentenoate hydratase/2-oxohepta-3-ene-1,7-dioic acid hydratase in catechol pathway